MIGGCLSSSMYPLTAEIWTKKRIINQDTGQTTYKWQFWKEIPCAISSFVSTSFKAQPTNESFREEYDKIQYLKMKTDFNVGRNVQITNIRNGAGEVLYREVELKGAPPTRYNAQGSAPMQDPFGSVVQYDTLLVRASDQSDVE